MPEARRCGCCQRMKTEGATDDTGNVFICDECLAMADEFLALSRDHRDPVEDHTAPSMKSDSQ